MLDKLIGRISRVLARRAGIRVSRVVVRALPGFAPEAPGCAIRCAPMKRRELLRWCADAGLELSEQHVRLALDRGDLCLGAYDGERLVGYQWIGFGPTPHVAGLWVRVRTGDCYIYKKFVHRDYRGLRIAGVLNSEANVIAERHGCERVICLVDLHNTASWQVAKRCGSWTAGYAGYLAWFGISIPFRSGGAAEQGFTLYNPPLDAQETPKAA